MAKNEIKKIHIIAEAGTNHNGKIDLAKKLVDTAHRAGADSIKFQMINTWGLYLPGEYEYGHYDIKEVIKLRNRTRFSESQYSELAGYCSEKKMPISCSVFDKESLDLLIKFDPPYIKMASCDLNNIRFLRQVSETGRKIILSTGMSTLKDIEKTLKEMERTGHLDIVLLHCVSVYPAKLKDMNLSFIDVLLKNFGLETGLSDHTENSIAACMALAKGATWFEKHFTTNRKLKGLDHAHALEEKDLIKYVADIHDASQSLQLKDEKISEAEKNTRKRARRSLYASRNINAGEVIKDEDVLIVRPENIMQADEIDFIIGRRIKQKIEQYEPFKRDMF